ncbi:MAG: DUF3592 domain-containing protein [Deltaproteobacteria bacterium]|nr:DUF3592 domain-containing protein [Deltaproteobacteria bacterium]
MKIRLIIGLILIIGGAASLIKALNVNDNIRTAGKWPCVEGEIIKSELIVARFTHRKTGASYSPEIQYNYIVNDKQYTSDIIMFGGVTPGRYSKMYKRYIEQYPKGKIVKVYYNPTKPHDAVLNPFEEWGYKKYFLLGSFLIPCGLFFIINFFTGFGEGLLAFLERSS